MRDFLIKDVQIVTGEKTLAGDLRVVNGRIDSIAGQLDARGGEKEVPGNGRWLFPGVIDDQVHFREPGFTHKGEIATESRAAVAGGVTSFMEMPNTDPQSVTQELLEAKYQRAAQVSPANYSFFMGATNTNLEEVLRTPADKVCGVKVFMGSSTGNMLVDDQQALEKLFAGWPHLIATHCEDEGTVRRNLESYRQQYGDDIPMEYHPEIRSAEACYLSSSRAVALAQKTGARLHVLHISTEKELSLFEPGPVEKKNITAEACIHHLWFSKEDYREKGALIKWNPAVKEQSDRDAIRKAVAEDRIDVLATDHAPHTLEEKRGPYTRCPSGGPLIQHSLVAALELAEQGVWDRTLVARKMAEDVARLFRIKDRGFIREGYMADLVLVEKAPWTVQKDNLLYKCGWSPFEGTMFQHRVVQTWVNGNTAYRNGRVYDEQRGERLLFNLS